MKASKFETSIKGEMAMKINIKFETVNISGGFGAFVVLLVILLIGLGLVYLFQ